MAKISVMIATNMNVPIAMTSSAGSVLRKAKMSINVSTAINATAKDAMKIMQESKFVIDAIPAIPNVVAIVFSKGIDRNNCSAQNVSIGV